MAFGTSYKVAAVRMGRWWLPLERGEEAANWTRYPAQERYRQLHAALTAAVTGLCGLGESDPRLLDRLTATSLQGVIVEFSDALAAGKFELPLDGITLIDLKINGWDGELVGTGDPRLNRSYPLDQANRDRPLIRRQICDGLGDVFPRGMTGTATGRAIVEPRSGDSGFGTIAGGLVLTDLDRDWAVNIFQSGEILLNGNLHDVASNTDTTITFVGVEPNGNTEYEVWAEHIEAEGTLLEAVLRGAAARIQFGDPDAVQYVEVLKSLADGNMGAIAGAAVQIDWNGK